MIHEYPMLERVDFSVQACFMFLNINVMLKYSLSHYVKIYDGNSVLKLQNISTRKGKRINTSKNVTARSLVLYRYCFQTYCNFTLALLHTMGGPKLSEI